MAKELISEMLIQCHKEGRKEGRKTTELRQSCKHCVDNELIQYKKNSKEKYTLVHLMLNVIVKSIMLQKFLSFFFFFLEWKEKLVFRPCHINQSFIQPANMLR